MHIIIKIIVSIILSIAIFGGGYDDIGETAGSEKNISQQADPQLNQSPLADSIKALESRAAQGDYIALYELSGMYAGYDYKGRNNGLRNEVLRLKYLSDAASLGMPQAQTLLANQFDKEKKYAESFILKKAAADQNFPPAQALLAMAYAQGIGAYKNYVDAYKWNYIAKQNGSNGGVGQYGDSLEDILLYAMPDTDIKKAEKMARKWLQDQQN